MTTRRSAERRTREGRLDLQHSTALRDVDEDPVRSEALLKERAARLARSPVQHAPRAAFLTLRIGGERYALGLERIGGIEDCAALTPIPGSPPVLAGMFCRRGEILTVVDLGRLLGIESGRRAGGTVVLLRLGGQTTGVLVDAADSVMQLDADAFETPRHQTHPLVRCMADGGALAVLDATALAAALSERSF